ncbi:ATP-binding cassette domain-containing protein [Coprobacillaceae bacterium CR2/5/TPMF4]|nr:ATP-binding cassette domain-containing protein [Coprobacillaceae bacterium CR2/5/TPMF4]
MNLTVEQNEFIGIVGTSGCGKSTLLHIIGGVDKADSGRIFLDDNEISSYDYKKWLVIVANRLASFISSIIYYRY